MERIESPRTDDSAIEQEIKAKGLTTGPRVKPSDVEANIKSEHYFTASDGVLGAVGNFSDEFSPLGLLTFCVLVLQNGFTVTGTSACVSPEHFDAEVGRKVARQNAVNQVWPLMGYALKERLHAAQQPQPPADNEHVAPGCEPFDTRPPHQQRVIAEERELSDKLAKLGEFINSPRIDTVSGEERTRLIDQQIYMANYAAVLRERIRAFDA